MSANALMQVLHQLPKTGDKNLLVGFDKADDAGVYRISDDTAVVATLDFFPPIVDDPFTFGQIAAANALSDVYAMGGVPRLAMNIVCYPAALPLDALNEILRGSMDKLNEAGVLLVGGHSIEDSEIKYGLSVTGFVHPERVITNAGARPGDSVILTKPIGSGVIASALKAGRIKTEDAIAAIESMKTLNKAASIVMAEFGVKAATDVTGYGLIGHAMEMCKASGVNMVIKAAQVPFFPMAAELVKKKNCRPKSIFSNTEFLKDEVRCSGVDTSIEMLMYDPQTSGGLLMAVPEGGASKLVDALISKGVNAAIIGMAIARADGWRIRVE